MTGETAIATLVMEKGQAPLMFKSIDGKWLMAIEYPTAEVARRHLEEFNKRFSSPLSDASGDPFERMRPSGQVGDENFQQWVEDSRRRHEESMREMRERMDRLRTSPNGRPPGF